MTNSIVSLTKTEKDDLKLFFQFQLDQEGSYLAAFTPNDSNDETAYIERYSKYLNDPSKNMRTIKIGNEIAGSISKFMMDGKAELTYWIDRKFWGKGIASAALKDFLELEQTRPIYGRTAFDNYPSQKVLVKCGFIKIGSDKGFAKARQAEIEEYIYELL
jgi:[ribosomal protein S5]-alanine N-acetyltransferase